MGFASNLSYKFELLLLELLFSYFNSINKGCNEYQIEPLLSYLYLGIKACYVKTKYLLLDHGFKMRYVELNSLKIQTKTLLFSKIYTYRSFNVSKLHF